MKLETVRCNLCGAPLSVPEAANYVTCNYCQTQLEIKRDQSVTYTTTLKQIDRRTEKMAEDLGYLRRQADLERLDREWDQQQQSYLIRTKSGQTHLPTESHPIGLLFVAAFGVLWTGIAFSAFPPMGIFGLLFIGFALFQFFSVRDKATKYRIAHQQYLQQREEILQDQQ